MKSLLKLGGEKAGVRAGKLAGVLLAAIAAVSCGSKTDSTTDTPPVLKADKAFVTAGSIEMQLDGGEYTIRAGSDDHIRVTFSGNPGNATAELTAAGTQAKLTVKDTPHNNFHAIVEVPAATGLTVRLAAGELKVGAITGNKDIESKAGNVAISVPNASDYASVEAAVKVGNLSGGPFGASESGLSPHLKWTGPGKYTLRADLMAGNLELRR